MLIEKMKKRLLEDSVHKKNQVRINYPSYCTGCASNTKGLFPTCTITEGVCVDIGKDIKSIIMEAKEKCPITKLAKNLHEKLQSKNIEEELLNTIIAEVIQTLRLNIIINLDDNIVSNNTKEDNSRILKEVLLKHEIIKPKSVYFGS